MDFESLTGKQSRPIGPLPRVLFVNDLWGYGTVTMAITIAEALEGRVTRLFAGHGPGFDLARRSCFDNLVHTDTMAEPVTQRLDRALDSCAVVISVMNEHVAHRAAQRATSRGECTTFWNYWGLEGLHAGGGVECREGPSSRKRRKPRFGTDAARASR